MEKQKIPHCQNSYKLWWKTKKYHTVGTVINSDGKTKKYHTVGTVINSDGKTKKYHTVRTVINSDGKTKNTTLSEQL